MDILWHNNECEDNFFNHPVLAEAKIRPHITAAYNEIKHKQAKVRQLWTILVNWLQSEVKAK